MEEYEKLRSDSVMKIKYKLVIVIQCDGCLDYKVKVRIECYKNQLRQQ